MKSKYYQSCLDHLPGGQPTHNLGQERWVFSRLYRLEDGSKAFLAGMPCQTMLETILYGLSFQKADMTLQILEASINQDYRRYIDAVLEERSYNVSVEFVGTADLTANTIDCVFFDNAFEPGVDFGTLAATIPAAGRNHALVAILPHTDTSPELEAFWHDLMQPQLRDPAEFFSINFGYNGFNADKFGGTIFVIIPVHNRIEYTLMVLKDLTEQTVADRLAIYVVDDGSTDNTTEAIATNFPQVNILKGDGSLFWTGGMAFGVENIQNKFKKGDYILLVNNDSRLPENTLEVLLSEAFTPKTCVVPMAVEGMEATACGWAESSAPILNNIDRINHINMQGIQRFDLRTFYGRCSLVPASAINDAGNFDAETFPHYHGDSDFGYRVFKAGYHLVATSKITISVAENKETTGLHATFFEGPQSLGNVYTYLTSIRSIDNYKYIWVYLTRYNRQHRGKVYRSVLWKVIRQYAPVYYVRQLFNKQAP